MRLPFFVVAACLGGLGGLVLGYDIGVVTGALESLEKEKCPKVVRQVLAEDHFAVWGTRVGTAMTAVRHSRYVERWCEWATKDLEQHLGYYAPHWIGS